MADLPVEGIGVTSAIVNALHHGIAAHPHPQAKATFGQMLAQALREQARAHAQAPARGMAPVAAAGSPAGGPVPSENTGMGGQMVEGPLFPSVAHPAALAGGYGGGLPAGLGGPVTPAVAALHALSNPQWAGWTGGGY